MMISPPVVLRVHFRLRHHLPIEGGDLLFDLDGGIGLPQYRVTFVVFIEEEGAGAVHRRPQGSRRVAYCADLEKAADPARLIASPAAQRPRCRIAARRLCLIEETGPSMGGEHRILDQRRVKIAVLRFGRIGSACRRHQGSQRQQG